MRESPALDVIHLLQVMGADITYHDPFVPSMRIENHHMKSSPYSIKLLKNADAVVITPRTASLTRRDPRALQARDRYAEYDERVERDHLVRL